MDGFWLRQDSGSDNPPSPPERPQEQAHTSNLNQGSTQGQVFHNKKRPRGTQQNSKGTPRTPSPLKQKKGVSRKKPKLAYQGPTSYASYQFGNSPHMQGPPNPWYPMPQWPPMWYPPPPPHISHPPPHPSRPQGPQRGPRGGERGGKRRTPQSTPRRQ